MACMDGTTRVALVSVLHPVSAAADGVVDQIWIAQAEDSKPSTDEALRALDILVAEASRARTLVQRLADESSAS